MRKHPPIEWTMLTGLALSFAVLFSGASLFTFQRSRIFRHNAKPTSAEVVELRGKEPVYQYAVDGNIFEYQPAHGPLTRGALGDSATLYFDSENPADVRELPELETGPASWTTPLLLTLAALSWISVAMFSFVLFQARRRLRDAADDDKVETACVFVALEGTSERAQTARRIRLICRWVHPETGEEWVLKSPSLHPAELPSNLEVGATLRCRVNFDNPARHDVRVA